MLMVKWQGGRWDRHDGKHRYYKIICKSHDLKTGPDQSVGPSTGAKTGPVPIKTVFMIEPALNCPNRRSDQ